MWEKLKYMNESFKKCNILLMGDLEGEYKVKRGGDINELLNGKKPKYWSWSEERTVFKWKGPSNVKCV